MEIPESKWQQFSNSNTFDVIALAVGVLLSVLLIGGVVWAVQSTNHPAYEPPAIEKGEQR